MKAKLAGWLLLAAAAAGGWAWFLHTRPRADWEMWSSVLAGFAAFLAIPGLAVAVMALRDARSEATRGSAPDAAAAGGPVVGGDITVGRDAYIAETQRFDQRGRDRQG